MRPIVIEPTTIAIVVLGVVAVVALQLLHKDGLLLAVSVCSGIAGWLSNKPAAAPATPATVAKP